VLATQAGMQVTAIQRIQVDKVKFVFAVLLVVAGLFGFYYFSAQPTVLRVLYVLAGVAAGAGVAWFTQPGQQFFTFAQEAWAETRKVVWPTRKESMQTTGAVFLFVLVMAIFLFITDKSLEWVLYDLVLGWKK
jgi:preprotein translocase subunit SecE